MSRLPYYGPPDANQFLQARRVTDTETGQPADIQQVDDQISQAHLATVIAALGGPETLVNLLRAIRDNTDTLEVKLDTVNLNTDTLEASSEAVRAAVQTFHDHFDLRDMASNAQLASVRDAITAAIGSASDEAVVAAVDAFSSAFNLRDMASVASVTDLRDTLATAIGSASDEAVVAAINAFSAAFTARDLASDTTLSGARDAIVAAVVAATDEAVTARLDTLIAAQPDETLTGRLLEKKPATGYRLWLHDNATTNLGVGTILAEAPTGTATTASSWSGIFVPSAGGQLTERVGFSWDGRLTGWVVE